ncbi:hypothetical protein BDW42DRAFT_127658 [Aspergillus taichungensis]|uniref:Saposin B-type domain-containing protein n=1 Tax=Aspergillus taichungensis TaxID=482145 RepID=A0A2J5HQB9_9EURO|nr:hypothetical protein BDW42DRAFT_127658 [Aspergillus taichungensis]
MRSRRLFLILPLILLVITGALIYRTQFAPHSTRGVSCADCLRYSHQIETKFRHTPENKDNTQFFRYALDKSCRGVVFLSGACSKLRRVFRDDVSQFMGLIQEGNVYEACEVAKACPLRNPPA